MLYLRLILGFGTIHIDCISKSGYKHSRPLHLNWINLNVDIDPAGYKLSLGSALPKYQSNIERLTIWNICKRSIDFRCWAPSVKHTIARDVSFLIRHFTFLSNHLLSAEQSSAFPFHFMMLLKLCNLF